MAVILASAAAQDIDRPSSFTMRSKALNEDRLVHVIEPSACRGSARPCAVLYVLDGGLDEDLPHVARAVRRLEARATIRPTVVVGVANTARRRDFTGPTMVASDREIAPMVGGSARFRQFLRDELIPEIDRRYRPSGERAIVGESLAGLFVVETLFLDPDAFTGYIALDPSLWWNGGALLDGAEAALGRRNGAARSLYVGASNEPGLRKACDTLAAMLRRLASPALRWTYAPRDDLTHATIFKGLEEAALAFTLR